MVSEGNWTDVGVRRVKRRIDKFANRCGWRGDTCQLLATLACIVPDDKNKHVALAHADDWYISAKTGLERLRAKKFKAFMRFAFGNAEDSIDVLEEVIAEFDRLNVAGDKETCIVKAEACNNLAYAYAEIIDTNAGERKDARANAEKYIKMAEELVAWGAQGDERVGEMEEDAAPYIKEKATASLLEQAWPKSSLLDTKGVVAIMCGKTVSEIDEGLRMCEEAVEATDAQYQETQRAFLHLHKMKALRRQLQIMESRGG